MTSRASDHGRNLYMKQLFYLFLLLMAAIFSPVADHAAAACQQWTGSNDAHVAANRAYVETSSFGCIETATYYAVGSDENLGASGSTNTTLYSDDNGQSYHQGACPIVPTDADSDGYTADVDCNDQDASIHPGAAETCGDGIDQDCSGEDSACSGSDCREWSATNAAHVNANRAYTETSSSGCRDTTTYFAVGSGENLGTSDTTTVTLYTDDNGQNYYQGNCPVVVADADNDGYAADVDCDDDNASVYPGAAEICGDGIDQDCNGGDLACSGGTDADQDGYTTETDCNDSDAAIHPGAAEVCGDGIDQDCSGSDLACSGGTDNDQDGYASDVDCDDGNPNIHPGATDYCDDGIDQDCSGGDTACLPPPSCITSLDSWKKNYAPKNSDCRTCHTTCTPGGSSGRHSCTEGEAWGSSSCTGCHSSAHR